MAQALTVTFDTTNQTIWDGLHYLFEDRGCYIAPRCLECPLPKCRHDFGPDEFRVYLRRQRDAAIAARCGELDAVDRAGRTERVAAEMGITIRSVFRALERQRNESPL